MAYVIKITNKNNDPNNVSLSKLYLGSIAPSLIINPDTPYSNYESDMSLSDGSVLVPLYQRQQFVKIPVNSVLVINTDNSDEAIYYAQCKVNNSAILVDPDPFGGSSGGTLIEKTITENGTYNAVDDEADGYSTVNVDVENSYTVEDNGKVVNNETLVSQTAYPITITQNDTYDTTNYNSVTVNVSGGGGISGSDVRFIDYDGTVVQSYSAADFANLSAMPENPTHTGLTAQGWNWSLADAKSYVANYGKLNIGQMYITSDGKTRLYFTVTKDNLSVELYLSLDSDTELDIDWGDNSEHTTWTSNDGDGSKRHEYASAGRYVIAITVITGEFILSTVVPNIYKAEIGNGVVSIGDAAFDNCYALSLITIPSGVTSIGVGAFYVCRSLTSITLPSSVTSISNSAFAECCSLTSITLPSSVTSIGMAAFYDCNSLTSITLPSGVTSIGEGIFYGCYSLTSITLPSGVTSIGDGAFGCPSLTSITLPSSVTSIGNSAFSNCYSLSSITIPSGVTSINNTAFENCFSLSSITIPNNVTFIGVAAFENCFSLSSITIPNSVKIIDENAFNNCYALSSITFESTTPPALPYGDLGIGTTCVIRVPQGSLSAYTSAYNYPNPTTYIYVEY